jgi:hypothetical protein
MDTSENRDIKDLKNFFANRSKEVKNKRDQILSVIGEHLEEIDNSTLIEIDKHQKKKDLTDLGNFLSLYDNTFVVEEALRTSPDFLIRKGNKTRGLELSDLRINDDSEEQTLNKALVLDAISKKEKDLSTYKSSAKVAEFWLLLMSDDLSDDTFKEELVNTAFDKVFLFDVFESKIIELK